VETAVTTPARQSRVWPILRDDALRAAPPDEAFLLPHPEEARSASAHSDAPCSKGRSMKGALVTGAGMRVGRALAMALAADGFFVFVHHYSSAAGARETVAEIVKAGGKAKAVKADLA